MSPFNHHLISIMAVSALETGHEVVAGFLLWLVPWAILLLVVLSFFYFSMSLPLQRRNKAHLVLDLLETGLASGYNVEQALQAMGRTRDPALGSRFHWLATLLERGEHLVAALGKVPLLLPTQTIAVLRAGQEIGDLRKVLPACRQTLQDGLSQSRAALNYQVVVAFVFNPMILLLLPFLAKTVLPVFSSILMGFGLSSAKEIAYFQTVLPLALMTLLFLSLLSYLAAIYFLAGPSALHWLFAGAFPVHDRILYHLPWRRKRLLRDFSAMLAILLDAGVPEARAIILAATTTANCVISDHARRAVEALSQGRSLTEAMRLFDDTGEFHWRLANAAAGQGGFNRALAGWHESLAAQAFQQEQAAAQFISTLLMLLNGMVVVLVAFPLFRLIGIVESGWWVK